MAELHYVTYSPTELWEIITDTYLNEGGDVLFPGDEKEILLRTVEAVLVQGLAEADTAMRMRTLRYAEGEYLDVIGEDRNIYRIEAQKALASALFDINTQGATIPAGTVLVQQGTDIEWMTTEDITRTSEDISTVEAQIECLTPGEDGNTLKAGTTLLLASPMETVDAVTCSADAGGGADTESDDAYRERVREAGLVSSVAGTASQYRRLTMAVNSRILDAKAVNTGAGEVTIYFCPTEDTPAEKSALAAQIAEAINTDDTRILTDNVHIAAATAIPYTLYANCQVHTGSAGAAELAAAAEEYTAWQNKKIGRAFNPEKLSALLYNAGAERVTWGSSSTMNGQSEIAYTEIGDGAYLAGTVAVTILIS